MDDVQSLSSFTFDACRCSLPLGLFGWLLRSTHSTPPTSVDFMSVFGRPSRKPPNVTLELIDTGRVTRSKVKRWSTGDLNTSIMEVTTTINKRKRGRPRSETKTAMKSTKTDMKSTDVGGVECVDRSNQPNKPNGREQRQASKVKKLSDRTSSIKRHLSGSASCRKL